MTAPVEVASNSTTLIAGVTAAITAGGFAMMQIARQYMTTRKDNAADKGAASIYELLTTENKRLAQQMTSLSMLVNENLSEKLKLLARVGELERKVVDMGDMEKENAELREKVTQALAENVAIRRENHDLRTKMQILELKVSKK